MHEKHSSLPSLATCTVSQSCYYSSLSVISNPLEQCSTICIFYYLAKHFLICFSLHPQRSVKIFFSVNLILLNYSKYIYQCLFCCLCLCLIYLRYCCSLWHLIRLDGEIFGYFSQVLSFLSPNR